MKKKLLILLAFISILGIGNVKAEKEILKTCNYYTAYMGHDLDAELRKYVDGTYAVMIRRYSYGTTEVIKYDGKDHKLYTPEIVGRLEKDCPSYMAATHEGTIFKHVNLYISDDSLEVKRGTNGFMLAESSDKQLSDIEIQSGEETIDTTLASIEAFIKEYEKLNVWDDSCKSDDIVTPYYDCENKLKERFNNIYQWRAVELYGLINSNDYWKNNSKIDKINELYSKAEDIYNQIKNEIEDAKKGILHADKNADLGEDIDANCESMLGPEITEFINDIFKIIMIAGPVLALVLGTFDLIKALASGEEDAKKKATKKVRGRIIAAVLLFLVPYIVKVLLDLANVAYDKDCPGMQNLYIMLEDLWRI